MGDLPQWLHLLLLAKRTLNSLLHFLQAGSEPMNSGGGPLRSGRPLGVLMVECGQGVWDNGVTKNLIGETARWYFVFPPALTLIACAMDTPHFRGPQLPTSHVVPGAPGAPGHPPHFGFAEPPPPFIIPAAFLTEIMMAVRSESAAQNRLLSNHYTNLKQDYNAIKDDFQLCVHQTDRILTEQYTRFELRLEGIQRGMQQFTVAIGDLGVRLDALEGATKASRETLTSDIAAVVETMGREFTTVVAMIKGEWIYSIYLSLSSRTTGEPLTLPIMDNTDVTTVPPPPSTIPEVIPITPSADHEPPQSPLPQDTTLFDAPSPLTPVSTPSSPDQEEYQSTSPEIEIPAPHPEPADPTPRKRRRASQGRRSTKRLRRGRKPYPRETQEDASHEVQQPEEDYADPLIWPPLIEDGISDQSVFLIIFIF